MTVYDNVTVAGAFGIGRLTGFEAHILPNAHARALVRGIAEDIADLVRWQTSEAEQEVTVSLKGGRILFCGIVESALWEQESMGVYRVELRLISGSAALDREKRSMSFQDTELSYAEIIRKAVSCTSGAYCICTAESEEKPMRPIIQYEETDWEFAKRIASIVGSAVYSEPCRHGAYIWMGIPECSEASVQPDTSEYIHGISSILYELSGVAAGHGRKDFEYYRVECGEDYRIGADALYAGDMWRVLEKHIRLERGEFRYTYVLGKRCLATARKTFNPLFAGRSIHGTVIASSGDCVKLHLEIDRIQDAASAYPYPWMPDTGSVMYCMPEKDTTVSLYFPDMDERNAIAVNCIRYNGASCNEMKDTSKRALMTTKGKRLYLESKNMGLDIKNLGHKVSLEDGMGIVLKSITAMNISAEKDVKLTAKTVSIETVGSLNLLRDPNIYADGRPKVKKYPHKKKKKESERTSAILEDFTKFVHEGSLTFADIPNLSSDKQEVLRAIYYTLHDAGYSNIIIAGVMGSVCTEGNAGQFEAIPYGSTSGYQQYHKLTWENAAYYTQFPHKETNNQGPEYEYANSYSFKTPWEIPDFTCQEFITMLNVGIAENELIFGVGASQSSYPEKHQFYIDAIKEYCGQNNIPINTVIDKDLAIQLESVYIEKRVDKVLSDDYKYQKAGHFMENKGWSPDQVVPTVISRMPSVDNSDEMKNVCRAATYWYVEEEACGGASESDAANRAVNAVKCYNTIIDYESNG